MSWIIFLTETDDTISPSPDAMPLWKKYFRSNSPCGVSTYLLVVTRLIVDSCMPMSSPTSRSESGRRCDSPRSRKSRWNLTIDCVTLRSVRWRWSTLLINQSADRSFCSTYCLASSPERAVEPIHPQARDAVLVENNRVLVAELVDEDVGRDVARVVTPEAPAGLRLEAHDLLDRFHDAIERQLHGPRDVLITPPAQVVEVRLDDLDRDRIRQRVAPKLEQQAFLDGPRRHPGRVEALHELEDLGHLVGGGGAPLGDLLELGAEIAVLVEVADDLGADTPSRDVPRRDSELSLEMVGQRGLGADDVLERQVLAVLLVDQRALLVVVVGRRHDRGEVERELVGLALRRRRRLG